MSKLNGHDSDRVVASTLRVTLGKDAIGMWEHSQRGESTRRIGSLYGVHHTTAARQVRRVERTLGAIRADMDAN